MPVDNRYNGRPPEQLKQLCVQCFQLSDVTAEDLRCFNCYRCEVNPDVSSPNASIPPRLSIWCTILSEPYPMTTEEWVKTVMSSPGYLGWRYGNMIRIRKMRDDNE